MSQGLLLDCASGYSVITPLVVMRPILLPADSVNQSAPSGPVMIQTGTLLGVGIWNSVMTPAVVIRPILPAPYSVNQSAPSRPGVIPKGWLLGVGIARRAKRMASRSSLCSQYLGAK